jgi:hypothetical protein
MAIACKVISGVSVLLLGKLKSLNIDISIASQPTNAAVITNAEARTP